MNEEFVKNSARNAQIDPKVVMDLSIFKIGGWNSLQPSNQKLLEEFIDENEPWLLIGIPNRDPFLVTQYLDFQSPTFRRGSKLVDDNFMIFLEASNWAITISRRFLGSKNLAMGGWSVCESILGLCSTTERKEPDSCLHVQRAAIVFCIFCMIVRAF